MDYRVESRSGVTVLTLDESHLDHSVSAVLKAELLILISMEEAPLILDLSNVKTCDSDGVSALLVAQRTLSDAGQGLKVAGAQAAVRKMLRISRLEDKFELYTSLRAARASLSPRAKPKSRTTSSARSTPARPKARRAR